MSQRQIERPQEKKPRPAGNQGPTLDVNIDIGGEEVDDILRDLDVIEHPEKYSQEQRDCQCFRPSRGGGFR
jgi:hypothetical protein